jgi:hypothetical protein
VEKTERNRHRPLSIILLKNMNKFLTFIKLSNRWFVDIPWDGMIEDLEMVSGSDLFLDCISNGKKIITLEVGTSEIYGSIKLTKTIEDEFGAFYKINTYEYKGEIWLCNVTKHLFEIFPDNFWFKIVR